MSDYELDSELGNELVDKFDDESDDGLGEEILREILKQVSDDDILKMAGRAILARESMPSKINYDKCKLMLDVYKILKAEANRMNDVQIAWEAFSELPYMGTITLKGKIVEFNNTTILKNVLRMADSVDVLVQNDNTVAVVFGFDDLTTAIKEGEPYSVYI